MTRKQRRFALIAGALAVLAGAVALILVALNDNIVFFFSPSDVAGRGVSEGQRIRLGGLVAPGSVVKGAASYVTFAVTDGVENVTVRYEGILPDLFREGQGVVVLGAFDHGRLFQADEVLAKHDETYMPPEVADALKRSGHWQGETARP